MGNEKFPKGVLRFPRLISDAMEAKLNPIVVEGFACYQRGHDANVDFGRVLWRFRKAAGHGNWESYFAVKFPNTVSVRTARRYMRLARREEAKGKPDKLTELKEGDHPLAQKIKAASAKGRAEVGPKKMNIPLPVPPERQDSVRKLQKSADWPKAEKEILFIILEKYPQSVEVVNADIAAD
jgi:hypothetical protein